MRQEKPNSPENPSAQPYYASNINFFERAEKMKKAIFVIVVFLFGLPPLEAAIEFKDGGTYDIDFGTAEEV